MYKRQYKAYAFHYQLTAKDIQLEHFKVVPLEESDSFV